MVNGKILRLEESEANWIKSLITVKDKIKISDDFGVSVGYVDMICNRTKYNEDIAEALRKKAVQLEKKSKKKLVKTK